MIVWLLVSLLLWVALTFGVWAVLSAHGTREERSLDDTSKSEPGRQ